LPGSSKKNPVEVYFLEHEGFFGREGLYNSAFEPDYLDNPRRFTFLSRAAFQVCRKIAWYPDVFHGHDWQGALVPVFLKFKERYPGSEFEHSVSVLTIHNLGYQGIYGKDNFDYTGLGWNVYFEQGFEDWGMMNMLKAGIYAADKISTVSGVYAEETKRQEYGFRLDGPLRVRSGDYEGITNGVDTKVWNPATDKLLPKTYTFKDMSGKALAKEALQKEFGLPVRPDVPIIGMVTRLAGQKGVGEVFGPGYGSAFSICSQMDVQMVLLGTGESWCENEIRSLAGRLNNFRAFIGYSEKKSHLIEAGSDLFLMPSRYEPCGLNQMYSMIYGTLPIVRNTGGLADTVTNYDQNAKDGGEGTGFMFDRLDPGSIYNTVGWAVWAWYNRKNDIKAMQKRGMSRDFSWAKSAKKYVDLYNKAQGKA
jgi:starch synthase